MAIAEISSTYDVGAHARDQGPINDKFGAGSQSRSIRRRAFAIYLLIVAAGFLPTLLHWSPGWQAAGLGLLAPGGGFFSVGGWSYLLVPVTWGLFFVSLALWVLTANNVAPLFIWGGSMALAAGLAGSTAQPSGPYVVPVLVVAFFAWAVRADRRQTAVELERRAARNAYLPRAEADVLARATPAPAPGTRELSAVDLASVRYALDRGLQPVSDLKGFDVIEQFQTSSVRYQLCYLLWALQTVQCHYTPNFHGYLSQAQRNLLDKLTLPKLWRGYWIYESLFGNYSFNFDPISKDNIMFGGFFSANLLMYTANTGDDRYLKPDSMPFRLNRFKTYKHSVDTILAAGRKNHSEAVYKPLYPCEPKLTYSACNLWGNFAHLIADRMNNTSYSSEFLKPLRDLQIEEMICRDGTVHSGRVTPLGIKLPVYTCNSVTALWSWMSDAFWPDLSLRTWAILREETISYDDTSDVTIATESYDRVDIGNYSKSDIAVYSQYLILANEQGDRQLAEAILRKLDAHYGRLEKDGVVSYTASNYMNAGIVFGRVVRTGDIRAMTLDGPAETAKRGPILTGVTYPDVLVAKAYSHTGTDLDMVLHPGRGVARQTLRVERLRPNAFYGLAIGGEHRSVRSDSEGAFSFDVDISGRTEINLTLAA